MLNSLLPQMPMLQSASAPQNPQLQLLQQLFAQPAPQVQAKAPELGPQHTADQVNIAILQALTKLHSQVGRKEGTLTTILLECGLTTDELEDAIYEYKAKKKLKNKVTNAAKPSSSANGVE
jgi:hypothetical protein